MASPDGLYDARYQSAPARSLLDVVPSDSATLPPGCRALYVGTQGDVRLDGVDDELPVTLVGVQGWVPVETKRVRATGTTATDIVALY